MAVELDEIAGLAVLDVAKVRGTNLYAAVVETLYADAGQGPPRRLFVAIAQSAGDDPGFGAAVELPHGTAQHFAGRLGSALGKRRPSRQHGARATLDRQRWKTAETGQVRRTGDQRRAAVHRCQQRLPELMGVADKGATCGERPAQAEGQTIEMVVNDRPMDPGRGGHGLSEQAIDRGGLEFELPHGLGNALGRARRARGEEGDARLFCVHGRQARYAVFVRQHQRALASRHRAVRHDMVEGA